MIPESIFPDPLENEKPALAANKEPAALKPDTDESNHQPTTKQDEAALQRLAVLSPLEFDRCAEAEAKALGVNIGTLRSEVAKRRRQPAEENMQGHSGKFEPPEPWPAPVNGAEVLGEVSETFTRHLVLPRGAADALTIWCAHAHCFDAFLCSPRLNIRSPEKGCGKTTALDLVTLFVPKPLKTENISVGVLFRVVEMFAPTLVVDEVDSFLKGNDELRGLLNAGHRRGGQAWRCVGEDHEPRGFNVFAPVVLAGIGQLPPTLHDRSIPISLVRAKPGEVRVRFDSRHPEREEELCRKVARWIADNRPVIEACDPALPPGCDNRTADNWRPLFAIAEAAGGSWPERMRQAYTALETGTDIAAHGRGVELLSDLRDIFDAIRLDKLPSQRICEELGKREDRPWPEYRNGQPISPVQLAKLLKPFDITPRAVRVGLDSLRGYHLEQFADAFARYLPPPDESATPATDQ